ncbi:MAG: dihydrolipoyllysine-residue acetyltransferase [Gammaproteobacteria bacterium]|nr:dihydrolipoyllysine-residue acetyltransferase [Gammaproteobacteria bacterium]
MAEVTIPDIGDFEAVEVIEILVSNGDDVHAEDPLVTLESDKATMEIPAPGNGTIANIAVSVGDQVSEGSVIMEILGNADPPNPSPPAPEAEPDHPGNLPGTVSVERAVEEKVPPVPGEIPAHSPPPTLPGEIRPTAEKIPHASPGVRRFARELGADVSKINGSGPKGRILKEDVKAWIKRALAETPGLQEATASGIPPIPEIDFSEFGETETRPLSRIRKLSGPHLQRAWLNIPHVTHHDEADITELEAFRKSLKEEAEQSGAKITLLSFIMKALVSAMKKFPRINASLSPDNGSLILKKYFNIGVAVDTPHGLVVPVVREVDRKNIFDLARDLAELSERARNGKLKPADLKGGCLSISSLGGIGGTSFTPIVNAPEVAILGVSRSRITPVWNGESFAPRLILPLSLSYDHRVVDGAEAARVCAYLARSFEDVRRLSL